MKRLAFLAIVLLVAGCAAMQGPPPLAPTQIDEMRWRDYQSQMFWYGPYGPLYRGYGWGPCRPGWGC